MSQSSQNSTGRSSARSAPTCCKTITQILEFLSVRQTCIGIDERTECVMKCEPFCRISTKYWQL
ncbi:unnamed protein product [Ceratitis capitata]|uniref:(Mediterranean fruit fly) hypothetical protein n=1 Tax=Ceratitis capitata TaxID=7213 RepID=A0A811V0U4_CERCA|nr:unnamed protein product [Ceratitis capitata]